MQTTGAQTGRQSALPALFRAVIDSWRVPDLRFRILFTLGILVAFRFLAHVPNPGVDLELLERAFEANPVFGVLDLFSGGALSQLSIAAMGVYPYITASIILQVLTPVIPQLRELSREGGEAGRRTLNRYTHYLTVPLAILQGWALLNTLELQGAITGIGLGGDDLMNTMTIILCMTATTMLLVWMGEIVTEKGIGNGISLIIFAGIVASLPQTAGQLYALRDQSFQVFMLIAMMLIIIFIVVIFNEAQRRVPVQYGRSVFRGGQMYRQTGASFIPLRVNAAGMIPLIFAFSIVTLPATIATYLADPGSSSFTAQAAAWVTRSLTFTSDPYWFLIFVLTVGFTFFYALVVHNQQNLAENLQRNGGFVPGIRPGQPTRDYLMRIVLRITWGGAIFLGVIAITPWIANLITNLEASLTLIQSTSMIIMVGVALDTMRQLEAQLMMRNYEGFVRS